MWDFQQRYFSERASLLSDLLASEPNLSDPTQVLPQLATAWCQHTRRDLRGTEHSELLPGQVAARLFGRETSLSFLNVQEYVTIFAALVDELERELDVFEGSTACNYHVSGPDLGTLREDHDAVPYFVFQLAGANTWRLHQNQGDEELVTRPGSVLFVPGSYSCTKTTYGDTVAVHLSFAVRPPLLSDLILDALRRGIEGAAFRSPVHCPVELDRDWDELRQYIDCFISNLDPEVLLGGYEPEPGGDALTFVRRYSTSFLQKLEEGRLRGYAV